MNIHFDFRKGHPNTAELVPHEHLAKIASDLILTNQATQYGRDLQGFPHVREQVASFLSNTLKYDVHPDQLMITAGAVDAIDLVNRALTNPGEVTIAEDPTFFFVINTFRINHNEVVPVPMLDDGMDLKALEAALKEYGDRVKMIYTIPSYHNPTGICTSRLHREQLIDLAAAHGVTIVEDATYQQLHLDAPAPPLLREIAGDRVNVITIGSFSKVLMPALRLGWIMADQAQYKQLGRYKTDAWTSPFASSMVAEYIRMEEIYPQVDRARELYRVRRDKMMRILDHHMPPGVGWGRPSGGFFAWVKVPDHVKVADVLRVANERGVDFMPGSMCFANPEAPDNYMRICFTLLEEAEMVAGVSILSDVIREML